MSAPHDEGEDAARETVGSTRGRLIGVSVALLVAVAIVLVTGFAWPGWFASESEPSNAAVTASPSGPSSTAQPPPGTQAPQPTAPDRPERPAPPGAQPPPAGTNPPAPAPQPGGDDAKTRAARVAAQTYADAVTRKDIGRMVGLVCNLTRTEKATYARYFQQQFTDGSAKLTLYGPTKTRGDVAQTRAKSIAVARGDRNANAITITMVYNNDTWCIPSRR